MIDVVDESRRMKSRAMDARDQKKYGDAVKILEMAEHNLREALEKLKSKRGGAGEPGGPEQAVANQLVHILGSKGGVLRRWGRYEQAADAYDAGYDFEKAESGYGIVNSYTLTQRLVTRAFIDPGSVSNDNLKVHDLFVRQKLLEARTEIRGQLDGKRSNDPYAAADLAMVRLLLDDKGWEEALDDFLDLKPDPYAVMVTHEVFVELHDAVAKSPSAPSDLIKRLSEACKRLQGLTSQ